MVKYVYSAGRRSSRLLGSAGFLTVVFKVHFSERQGRRGVVGDLGGGGGDGMLVFIPRYHALRNQNGTVSRGGDRARSRDARLPSHKSPNNTAADNTVFEQDRTKEYLYYACSLPAPFLPVSQRIREEISGLFVWGQ